MSRPNRVLHGEETLAAGERQNGAMARYLSGVSYPILVWQASVFNNNKQPRGTANYDQCYRGYREARWPTRIQFDNESLHQFSLVGQPQAPQKIHMLAMLKYGKTMEMEERRDIYCCRVRIATIFLDAPLTLIGRNKYWGWRCSQV